MLDTIEKRKEVSIQEKEKSMEGKLFFVRLNRSERVQHLIFVTCFILLAVTGFMAKAPESIVSYLGSSGDTVFQVRSLVHRIAGTLMILVSLYHLYYLLFKPAGRRWIFDMFPRIGDISEAIANILYYIGLKSAPPEFGRFCYKHKLEYFALIAGTIIMSVTGLLLWTESRWDKFIIDIAMLVHGMEALLACLAVMVWHIYEVHLKPHKFPMDNMWLTGIIDEEEMRAEFPRHYRQIMENPKLQKIFYHQGTDIL